MDNHITTILELFAKDRVDRANYELQAAKQFQQQLQSILEAHNGTSTETVPQEDTNNVSPEIRSEVRKAVDQIEKDSKKKSGARKSTRSPLADSMVQVMANKVMSAGDVAEALIEADLAPSSGNLKGYISSVFSSARDENGEKLFRTVSRGQYRVYNGQSPKADSARVEVKPAKEFDSPADRLLAEAGLNCDSFTLDSPSI